MLQFLKNLVAIPLTIIHLIIFGIILGIFHIAQLFCWYVIGPKAHKKSVDLLNYFLILNYSTLLVRVSFEGFEKLPHDVPLIIISNHQGSYDIPPIVHGFRRHSPKFISKIELAKGIPSISFNLRKGGSALINRSDRKQSITEIIRLGRLIEENNYSASIFPEGTRSRDGKLKHFKEGGIAALLKTSPSAQIIPFAINNNYLFRQGKFPMGIGFKVTYKVLDLIERDGRTDKEIVSIAHQQIKEELANTKEHHA